MGNLCSLINLKTQEKPVALKGSMDISVMTVDLWLAVSDIALTSSQSLMFCKTPKLRDNTEENKSNQEWTRIMFILYPVKLNCYRK